MSNDNRWSFATHSFHRFLWHMLDQLGLLGCRWSGSCWCRACFFEIHSRRLKRWSWYNDRCLWWFGPHYKQLLDGWRCPFKQGMCFNENKDGIFGWSHVRNTTDHLPIFWWKSSFSTGSKKGGAVRNIFSFFLSHSSGFLYLGPIFSNQSNPCTLISLNLISILILGYFRYYKNYNKSYVVYIR